LDLGGNEVGGGWRKLCNEELHNLYVSPIIIIETIKSRMVRLVSDVACIGATQKT